MANVGLGIDVGAETLKMVLVEEDQGAMKLLWRWEQPHLKDPQAGLRAALGSLGLDRIERVAVTGRLRSVIAAAPVPTKAALRRGAQWLRPDAGSMTVLSIGARGFSALEIRETGQDWFQQNSRCSQGTGNFLEQLVERFGLSVEEASQMCADVTDPCALSGRCPVILKSDMTHLANCGEDRRRILAGLYDAVCDNVVSLLRPRLAPRQVVLTGGVTRSQRVRLAIEKWLRSREMLLLPEDPEDAVMEAIGAAEFAVKDPAGLRSDADLATLFAPARACKLERVPSLWEASSRVKRMPTPEPSSWRGKKRAVLGLDIGSTGSKAVAVDLSSGEGFWESYLATDGTPVLAAQQLVGRFAEQVGAGVDLLALGVTGSGREIVGTLLRTCYGEARVFVLNEIAAHARGAVALDPAVDTIFEIGGQDAKYIRLDRGKVIDAAMNEACSAGTGSFIAEQGCKFDAGGSPEELGRRALLADHGISLGQHCSVFMAEVIDEAIGQGEHPEAIIAGLYDSVIQNYLNRVKGPRSVGERIFCQGMPFAADALAAAVVRQTGRDVVVPPNPGTVGAFGIALLGRDERAAALRDQAPLATEDFLSARVKSKETVLCRSTQGCGGSGNKCRIDRLTTSVAGVEQRFFWGGSCSLYDKGSRRLRLADQAPDPFREREAMTDELLEGLRPPPGAPLVAFADEFGFKGFSGLYATFLNQLGLRCRVLRRGSRKTLRRGIEGAAVAYCAPLQLYHGAYFDLADEVPGYLLAPVFCGLPRVADEEHGTLCPMVIASSDLLADALGSQQTRLLAPVVDFDSGGYQGPAFRNALAELARSLGREDRFDAAFARAIEVQRTIEARCQEIGERALRYCQDNDVVPVAVLGRPYTIYNDVLNSNVPSLLRGLGALPIPVDCLPLDRDVPLYRRQYWSHTQRNLRAAEFVRRTPGLYPVFCSNYACGPDSFTLHFFGYTLKNKPFAVIETDGHSGDAGTKTRLEAFLYCVDTDRRSGASVAAPRNDLAAIEARQFTWDDARARGDCVLLPRMGPQALVAAAALRAEGLRAEALPLSDREDLRTGRRLTSGKECIPMILTLGTLLNRVAQESDPNQTFSFFMPTANGPCRFGVYNSLHKLVLEQQGLKDRICVISPGDSNYFEGMNADFSVRLWTAFLAHDVIQAMRLYVRPHEREPGLAEALYQRYLARLLELLEGAAPGSTLKTARELIGPMWGIRRLVKDAAEEFSRARCSEPRWVPTVAVVGEIYVRLDPFANDDLVLKLEERGLRVHFAPFVEWLEYANEASSRRLAAGQGHSSDDPLVAGLSGLVQRVTARILYGYCERALGWPARTRIEDILETGERYVHNALAGEAVLTIGGPTHEHERGVIDGVVIIGPHECMPCKIAEARYARVCEKTGLPYLAVSVGGDGIDTDSLDRFAFDLFEHRWDLTRRQSMARGLGIESAPEVPWQNYELELVSAGE